ncbi:MAG: hypothetical protein GHCLOJNM_04402 [bacterium]|nr:hypothetical protein [bacterium]
MKRKEWRFLLYGVWLLVVGLSVGLALVRTTEETLVDSVLVVLLAVGMLTFFLLEVVSSRLRSQGIKAGLQDFGMVLLLWAPILMLARMLVGLVQSGSWLPALIVAWFEYILISVFFAYLEKRKGENP